jgi:hypothetical protein
MSYIGNPITTTAFLTDQFNGDNSTTAFTLSTSPANPASILVSVSGVLQDPTTYSISGRTLNFSGAPPVGTGNISIRYLGIPASGVTTTAYRTLTEFTATAGQTTFTPPSYTVGFINVFRNGVRLGTADFTATNGTTVVLASGASTGDLVVTESFYVSSVLNAIPNTANSVGKVNLPLGTVLQTVYGNYSTQVSNSTGTFTDTGVTATITPFSSTSKILVLVTVNGIYNGANANTGVQLAILRGATNLNAFTNYICYLGTASYSLLAAAAANYLDSPATTSATTYKVQFARNAGSGSVGVQWNSDVSSITLIEVAA